MDFFLIFIQHWIKDKKNPGKSRDTDYFLFGNHLSRQFVFFPFYLCNNRLYGLVQTLLK
jgi:hypothetical protein